MDKRPSQWREKERLTGFEALQQYTRRLKEKGVEHPRLNAELLLAKSLNISREELYKKFRDPLDEDKRVILESLIQRRIAGEPLQYILGFQEFWSIDLKVDPRVLIPRPETELLVEQSLLILKQKKFERPPSILELGTGSGAIAIALAKELKEIFLVATDISLEALEIAKENIWSAHLENQIQLINGDLFAPLSFFKGKAFFDLIVSNPPYICRKDLHSLAKEIKDYEPHIALDGGLDGLEFYRKIISQAHHYLRDGGWLLLEMGQGQSQKVLELISQGKHFLRAEVLPDLSGIERVVKAQKSGLKTGEREGIDCLFNEGFRA